MELGRSLRRGKETIIGRRMTAAGGGSKPRIVASEGAIYNEEVAHPARRRLKNNKGRSVKCFSRGMASF
jgi:hypothetical protein